MKTVMCFGTFDVLHLGHLSYFGQAKQHGDYLIVVIARDKTKQDQGKLTIFNEHERRELVSKVDLVDEAIVGNHGNHFQIIQELKPDVVCLGYDQPITEEELQEKIKEMGLQISIMRATPYKPERWKSSRIRGKLLAML